MIVRKTKNALLFRSNRILPSAWTTREKLWTVVAGPGYAVVMNKLIMRLPSTAFHFWKQLLLFYGVRQRGAYSHDSHRQTLIFVFFPYACHYNQLSSNQVQILTRTLIIHGLSINFDGISRHAVVPRIAYGNGNKKNLSEQKRKSKSTTRPRKEKEEKKKKMLMLSWGMSNLQVIVLLASS